MPMVGVAMTTASMDCRPTRDESPTSQRGSRFSAMAKMRTAAGRRLSRRCRGDHVDIGQGRQVSGQSFTLIPHTDDARPPALAGGRLGSRGGNSSGTGKPDYSHGATAAFRAREPKNCRRLTSCFRKSSTFTAGGSCKGPVLALPPSFYHCAVARSKAQSPAGGESWEIFAAMAAEGVQVYVENGTHD